MGEQTDRELLKLVRSGDRAAAEVFARRHWAWTVDYARRVGAGDQADDVASTVLSNLLLRPTIDLKRKSARPLLRVAILASVKRLTYPQPDVETCSALVDPATSPSAAAARRQVLDAVAEQVADYRTQKRLLFSLRFCEEMPAVEIEQATGRPAATIRRDLSRIRAALRSSFFSS